MKHNKFKKRIVYLVLFSMLSFLGVIPSVPEARAIDSITSASLTVSDSDINATGVTHTFVFTTGTTTPINGYWRFVFNDGLTGVVEGNISCSGLTASSSITTQANCVAAGAVAATTTTVTITGMSNPNSNTAAYVDITVNEADGTTRERVRVATEILDDTLMTARVDSNLSFSVVGVTQSATINGITCDVTTTATTVPFGSLPIGASTTLCQDLRVNTNASDGYIVTVEQDGELTSDAGDTINSFNNAKDGTGSTTVAAWTAPLSTIDAKYTYGHMGLTSDDTDLTTYGYNDFYNSGAPLHAGLSSTDTMVVLHHNGPAINTSQDKGKARVGYTIEVGTLQEAGDYESRLTYIATPTF